MQERRFQLYNNAHFISLIPRLPIVQALWEWRSVNLPQSRKKYHGRILVHQARYHDHQHKHLPVGLTEKYTSIPHHPRKMNSASMQGSAILKEMAEACVLRYPFYIQLLHLATGICMQRWSPNNWVNLIHTHKCFIIMQHIRTKRQSTQNLLDWAPLFLHPRRLQTPINQMIPYWILSWTRFKWPMQI